MFPVVVREGRIVRNPKTGETIELPDKRIPKVNTY